MFLVKKKKKGKRVGKEEDGKTQKRPKNKGFKGRKQQLNILHGPGGNAFVANENGATRECVAESRQAIVYNEREAAPADHGRGLEEAWKKPGGKGKVKRVV